MIVWHFKELEGWTRTERKAKYNNLCDQCHELIMKGQKYVHYKKLFNKGIGEVRMHLECEQKLEREAKHSDEDWDELFG